MPFQPPQGDLAILAGSANPKLARDIAGQLGVTVVPSQAQYFSEGNVFVRVLENVRGRDVFVVQGIHHPVNDNFMELLFWIDALKRASAASVTAVIPYFSYAKGDKKDEPRVSIRARVCTQSMEAAGADRAVMLDLHAPQIQGFFHIPVDDLYALPVLVDAVRDLNLSDLVVVSPDAGFAKKARQFAKRLGAPLAIADKERIDHTENARVVDLIGNVAGRHALIVDDFTITAGTLVEVADCLMERGALSVHAAVSHGVFTGNSMERLDASPITKLLVTDSVENHPVDLSPKVQVVSVAPLFAEAIRRIHRRESVSVLFTA
jgi:ribose-phosphate pyrophosphokinase